MGPAVVVRVRDKPYLVGGGGLKRPGVGPGLDLPHPRHPMLHLTTSVHTFNDHIGRAVVEIIK